MRLDKDGILRDLRNTYTIALCRRYPKHVHESPNDWCGEFQPIKETANTNQEEI